MSVLSWLAVQTTETGCVRDLQSVGGQQLEEFSFDAGLLAATSAGASLWGLGSLAMTGVSALWLVLL